MVNPITSLKIMKLLRDLEEGFTPGDKAIEELVKIGKPAVQPLIDLVQKNPYRGPVKSRACQVLGRIGDPVAVNALIALLNDRESYVKRDAADALGAIGDVHAIAPLIQGLRDWENNRYCAEALARIGEASIEPLLAALDDPNRLTRGYAAKALGEIGNHRAVPRLIDVLSDLAEDIWVRRQAAEALGRIGDRRALLPLLQVLDVEDVGISAAVGLGELGDPGALDPLVRVLNDTSQVESEKGRIFWGCAARALGHIGDPGAIEPLIQALPISGGIWGVEVALSDIGESSARPLMQLLERSNWFEQCRAAHALGYLGETKAVEPLTSLLTHENKEVRRSAEFALFCIQQIQRVVESRPRTGDARIVQGLIQGMQGFGPTSSEREMLAGALKKIAPDLTDPAAINLLKQTAAKERDDRIRVVAKITLRRCPPTGALSEVEAGQAR